MKMKCDVCCTEYCTECKASGAVKCAVCGNTWSVSAPTRRNTILVFIASLCALLSAIVFTVAVITHHQATHTNRGPLVASVSGVDTTTDDAGVSHLVVHGTITNMTGDIYGVPDLIIVSQDDDGRVLAQQKFLPSATLLDAGASVGFSHILSRQPAGVKKISAHLAELETPSPDGDNND